MSKFSRAAHYVLKIGDLKKNIEFFRDELAMRVLRHEVFDEGCEAACNGPYANKWSKTMIGYGPEDDYFVLELTYNYSVGSYQLGNDLQHIKITIREFRVWEKILAARKDVGKDGPISVKSPDGYQFIISRDNDFNRNDITEVCLSCSNLKNSTYYWNKLMQMELVEQSKSESVLHYRKNECCLRLRQLAEPIDRKTAYGRIAFGVPTEELPRIQAQHEKNKQTILTPLLSLDTPGKPSVQVVILADPDGHEICYVGEEAFRELSEVDMDAEKLIEKTIAEDKSQEWFEKKGLSKKDA